MKLEGTRSFSAPRHVLWEVLNDPEQMAAVMPGVEGFDVQDEAHWTANVVVPLGLGGLRMKMDFEKIEQREPDYAKLRAKGKGVGALVNMETAFHLAEEGQGTEMRWEADVRIAGPVGSMGQRVMQPIINQQVGNVLDALDQQVQKTAGDGGGGSAEELQDAGPPAEGVPGKPEGTSGGEEGVSPLASEAYEEDPEGPFQPA